MHENLLKTSPRRLDMTSLQYAYLDSLSLIDLPETEEDQIDQAYARLVYLIDHESVDEITDVDEYLFHDQMEEGL
jgi:hypothetical protein